MQYRMNTAFQNVVRRSNLNDQVKRELAGPTPQSNQPDLDLFSNQDEEPTNYSHQ